MTIPVVRCVRCWQDSEVRMDAMGGSLGHLCQNLSTGLRLLLSPDTIAVLQGIHPSNQSPPRNFL